VMYSNRQRTLKPPLVLGLALKARPRPCVSSCCVTRHRRKGGRTAWRARREGKGRRHRPGSEKVDAEQGQRAPQGGEARERFERRSGGGFGLLKDSSSGRRDAGHAARVSEGE